MLPGALNPECEMPTFSSPCRGGLRLYTSTPPSVIDTTHTAMSGIADSSRRCQKCIYLVFSGKKVTRRYNRDESDGPQEDYALVDEEQRCPVMALGSSPKSGGFNRLYNASNSLVVSGDRYLTGPSNN